MASRKPAKKKVEEPNSDNTEETIEVNPILIAAADDLNQVLGMQPPIDLEANEEDLLTQITTASGEVLAADKKALKPETWGFLEESGLLKHLDTPKEEKTPASSDEKKKVVPKKAKDTAERNAFVKDLISEGKYTAKEIADKTCTKFTEHKRSSIQTLISDSKNEKYTKFETVAKMDPDTKILSF